MLLRGILGCRNLNCNGSSNDPNYASHAYNNQFIASNQTAYNAGSKQLGTVDGAAQFAGRAGMSATAAREKGNGDADMPEMRVEIGREMAFVHSGGL